MWKRLSLRARIFFILFALVVVTLVGGLVTMYQTEGIDKLLTSLIDRNLASFQAAEELGELPAQAEGLFDLLLSGRQSRLA